MAVGAGGARDQAACESVADVALLFHCGSIRRLQKPVQLGFDRDINFQIRYHRPIDTGGRKSWHRNITERVLRWAKVAKRSADVRGRSWCYPSVIAMALPPQPARSNVIGIVAALQESLGAKRTRENALLPGADQIFTGSPPKPARKEVSPTVFIVNISTTFTSITIRK